MTDNGEFRGFTKAELQNHERWMERIEDKLDGIDARLRKVEVKAAGVAATVSLVVTGAVIVVKALL